MKKALAILLSILLLMAAVPMGALSVSAVETYGSLFYTIAFQEVVIMGCGPTATGHIEIPASINGYPTTTIQSGAFQGCASITSVTIPNGVSDIGSNTFSGCTSLTSVTIPDSVTTIGRHAFDGCTSLVSVNIPDKVTTIESGAFYYCSALPSITLPDNVTSIGVAAFVGCTSLTSVTIPDSVTTIGECAFAVCSSLTDVYYRGTEADRANIAIGSDNAPLLNATWHYAEAEGSRLEAGETITVTITEGGEMIDFFFTPTVSGDYIFGSLSYDDTYGYLLDADGNELAYNDDGGEETNFRICHYLTAGTTYILRTRYYSSSTTGAYEVYLVRYGDHSYDADCDDTCNYCGEWRYTYAAHIYDGDCDDSCDECGEWREPPHCYDDDCDYECNWCLAWREPLHNYDYDCDEWCNDCGAGRDTYTDHYYYDEWDEYCYYCNEWREVIYPGCSHDYDNACDPECNWCYEWREVYHDYDYDCDDECNVCGEERAPYDDHTYSDEWDEYCDYCGEWREVVYACGHEYDNACDFECNWCYEWRDVPDHVYDGDCDEWCNVCDTGRATYSGHIYDDDCDEYCNVCGEWHEPLHYYASGCDEHCNCCGKYRETYENHTYDDADITCNECGYVRCLTYTITDGEVTITGYTADLPAEVVIPSTIEGYPVTTIGSYAFRGCSSLVSVAIPDSVTTIGYSAFYQCTVLASVTIPDSVTFIDGYAFGWCTALESVTIPDAVTSIEMGVFWHCTALKSVTIPDGVTYIDEGAFGWCTALESVTIPDSVTRLAEAVFTDCDSLTSIILPKSVIYIGCEAFYSTDSLTDIYYAGTEEDRAHITIGLDNDHLLAATWHYHWGEPHTYGAECDADCNICGEVREAYDHNYSDGICRYCGMPICSVTSCTYDNACDADCNICGAIREVAHTYDDTADVECNVCGFVRYLTYTITDGEVTITGYTADLPADLVIPSTIEGYPVAMIGDSAFSYCLALTSVTIPGSVLYIGFGAFQNCSSLASVSFGEGVTTIRAGAFADCCLTSVTLPASVSDVSPPAFCGNISAIYVDENNPYYCSVDGVLFNKEKTSLVAYPGGKGPHYTVPNGVTTIGFWAFNGVSSLVSLTIPEGFTTIESSAFFYCQSLTSIYLPRSLTTIGNTAFYDCTSLTDVYYAGTELHRYSISLDADQNEPLLAATWHYAPPEILTGTTGDCAWVLELDGHLTISGNGAMADYSWGAGNDGVFRTTAPWGSDVTRVTIEDGVTHIGNSAFAMCNSLTLVTIGNAVTSIGDFAFLDCDALLGVTIPNGVKSIGNDAFSCCSSLFSMTIPDSVTTIKGTAFSACTSLTSVTLGNGVAFIGDYAFYNCTSLTDIYYAGTEEDKANIAIGTDNASLLAATWHYGVSDQPAIVYGDTNGDGGINNRDLVLLLRYVNGWDVTLDLAAADVNGDGRINNRDVVLLQRYINGWDVQLGPDTPLVALPELGYDPDGKGRIILSAIAKKGNEVSVTFVNVSSRWMTEETSYIRYICTDADGNVLTLDDTYYGYIYFGMLEAGWTKTLIITLPEGTAKMEFGDYRIVYWTQWA